MSRVLGIMLALVWSAGGLRAQEFQLQQIATGFTQPVDIANAGDGSGRLFVVQQSGQIRVVQGTNVLATPFLDISGQTLDAGEQGLLGLAFHPGYRTNGYFFVYFTNTDGSSNVVWRF